MALPQTTPAATPLHPTLRVTASTFAVMLATLASMVLGFAREVVNAKYFGERWELDAFLVAAIIPTLVFGVFNGALVSALVPIFSGYFAEGKSEEAWRLLEHGHQRTRHPLVGARGARVDRRAVARPSRRARLPTARSRRHHDA